MGERRWAPQEAGSPPAAPTPLPQQMLSAPIGHRGPQQGSPIWRQRPGTADKYSRVLAAGRPAGRAREGRGRGREWAWPAHATVARATALFWRGLLGHCPGHTGRVIHQMAVCCLSQLSGDRVKECGQRGGPGRHLFLRLRAPGGH